MNTIEEDVGMKKDDSPKVLLGSPVTTSRSYKNYCLEEYLENLGNLTYPNMEIYLLLNEACEESMPKLPTKREIGVGKIPHLSSNVETVVNARNILRQKTLDEGFDYLVFVEQDIVPQADLVERLIADDKPVCSALYFNELVAGARKYGVDKEGYFPMCWMFFDVPQDRVEGYSEVLVPLEAIFPPRLMEADIVGLGAVAIHRDVLKKIGFRYIEADPQIFEEFCFGRDCRVNKIPIYLDSSIICGHYSSRGDSLIKKQVEKFREKRGLSG